MVTPWGKCSSSVKTTIPEETERLLRMHAARTGATEAEIVRNMLIEKFHGLDMATSSLVEHFRSTVRTGPQSCALLNEPPEVAELSIADWEAYEAAKHAWLNQNLDCTAHEYESAMRRILKEIGL